MGTNEGKIWTKTEFLSWTSRERGDGKVRGRWECFLSKRETLLSPWTKPAREDEGEDDSWTDGRHGKRIPDISSTLSQPITFLLYSPSGREKERERQSRVELQVKEPEWGEREAQRDYGGGRRRRVTKRATELEHKASIRVGWWVAWGRGLGVAGQGQVEGGMRKERANAIVPDFFQRHPNCSAITICPSTWPHAQTVKLPLPDNQCIS